MHTAFTLLLFTFIIIISLLAAVTLFDSMMREGERGRTREGGRDNLLGWWTYRHKKKMLLFKLNVWKNYAGRKCCCVYIIFFPSTISFFSFIFCTNFPSKARLDVKKKRGERKELKFLRRKEKNYSYKMIKWFYTPLRELVVCLNLVKCDHILFFLYFSDFFFLSEKFFFFSLWRAHYLCMVYCVILQIRHVCEQSSKNWILLFFILLFLMIENCFFFLAHTLWMTYIIYEIFMKIFPSFYFLLSIFLINLLNRFKMYKKKTLLLLNFFFLFKTCY